MQKDNLPGADNKHLTRFQRELNGEFGEKYKKWAESMINGLEQQTYEDKILIDRNGAAYWKESGNYLDESVVEVLSYTDFAFSEEETIKAGAKQRRLSKKEGGEPKMYIVTIIDKEGFIVPQTDFFTPEVWREASVKGFIDKDVAGEYAYCEYMFRLNTTKIEKDKETDCQGCRLYWNKESFLDEFLRESGRVEINTEDYYVAFEITDVDASLFGLTL